jgi:hypothetical protein
MTFRKAMLVLACFAVSFTKVSAQLPVVSTPSSFGTFQTVDVDVSVNAFSTCGLLWRNFAGNPAEFFAIFWGGGNPGATMIVPGTGSGNGGSVGDQFFALGVRTIITEIDNTRLVHTETTISSNALISSLRTGVSLVPTNSTCQVTLSVQGFVSAEFVSQFLPIYPYLMENVASAAEDAVPGGPPYPPIAVPPSGDACNGTYNGTFLGSLTVSAGQTCTFSGGGVTGDVRVTGGTLSLQTATVGGNVQVQGGGTISLTNATYIRGDLQIQNLSASAVENEVCGVTVKGNLQYQNNGAPVQIGEPPTGVGVGAISLCPGNKIGGNIQALNNTAEVDINYNAVSGSLQADGNTAAVNVSSNTVKGNLQVQNDSGSAMVFSNAVTGNLQCSGNAAITGGGNTASQKQGQCSGF